MKSKLSALIGASLISLSSMASLAFGADLQPTDDMLVLKVTAKQGDGSLIRNGEIVFTSGTKVFSGETNGAGEVQLLIPEGLAYSVYWNSDDGKVDVGQKLPIPRYEGAVTVPVELTFVKKVTVSSNVPVEGKIQTAKGRLISGQEFQLKSKKTGKVYTAKSEVDGSFSVKVPRGQSYVVSVLSLAGLYQVENDYFVPGKNRNIKRMKLNIEWDDTKFELKNIFFDVGKASLQNRSYAKLKEFVTGLTKNPSVVIEISGHTDSDGQDDYNQKLSEARANSVRDYLMSKGVDGKRIKAVGYGETQPRADNSTAAGKARNRRIEVKILEK